MRCELLLLGGFGWLVSAVGCTQSGRCFGPLEVEPEVLAFGDVEVGSTAERSFAVTSRCRPLQRQDVEITADFTGGWSWTPEAWTDFAGGESIEVRVTYAPLEEGDHEAFLYLASTLDPGSYEVVETHGVAVTGVIDF